MALALTISPETSTKSIAHPARRRQTAGLSVQVEPPRLSIVIVNYRFWEETGQLVRSLIAETTTREGHAEVVVVDNHSPVHPLMKRLRRWPSVSMRRWDRNRGFARAVNEGCRLSRGQWVLLLNPDVTVAPGFLDDVFRIADELAAHEPRAGVVGFQLRNSDGSRQLSCGPFPTLMHSVARLLLPRPRRKYHDIRSGRRRRVSWVSGCCLLVRRACLEDLGGLDRDYFLYYEDVDFCRRAQARGWSVYYEPRLRATHHRPLHLRSVSPYMRLLTRHALMTYASKHWPGWQSRILGTLVEWESRIRRRWAMGKGNSVEAEIFDCLTRIARGFRIGSPQAARKDLEGVVRLEECKLDG